MHIRLGWLAAAAAVAGCALSAAPPATDLNGEKTWSGVVGPLVLQRCATCHRAGDIGPFPLETWEQVLAMRGPVLDAVRAGRMPPFPPLQTEASGCPPIEDVRRMTEDERAVLVAWLEEGAPQGEARELPAAKAFEPLGPPSDVYKMLEEYEPAGDATAEDDYRCFPIDPVFLTSYPVAAISAVPGNRAVVHHASVYLIPPGGLDEVRRLDAEDPGPGYKCFSGVGTTALPAAVWVPGNDAPLVPTHTALGYHLAPGWTFVLQNHYNYAAGRGPDRTAIAVWKTQSPLITEVPRALIAGNMDFEIPPGAMGYSVEGTASFVSASEITVDDLYTRASDGRIYAVWAHQHLKGRSFKMDLVHADGSSQCLLDIPKWDFDWQSIYRLKTPVAAKAGDTLTVRCTWDNPGDTPVRYGEDTDDEMCFGSAALTKP